MKHDVDQLLYEIDALKAEIKTTQYLARQLRDRVEELEEALEAERSAYVALRLRHHLQDKDDWTP